MKIANDCDTWAALSEDGQLEVGRLESGARWTVRIPPNPQLHDWDFFDPYDNPIALSGNGKLCVVSDGDQITAVEVDGGSVRRTIQVPRRIFRLRISNDGKRLFAVCDPNPHTLAVLCDVADGHYTKLPAGIVASHASDWAGDDILASEADSNIMKITTLGKSRSYEKIVPLTELRFTNRAKSRPINDWVVPDGPMATSQDGAVLAVSTFNRCVCVIGIPALMLKYDALSIVDLDKIRMITVSGDGRKVAVTDGRTVYLADMESGTDHLVIPHAGGNVARSLQIIFWSILLLSGSIWLLWRTRIEKEKGAELKGTTCQA